MPTTVSLASALERLRRCNLAAAQSHAALRRAETALAQAHVRIVHEAWLRSMRSRGLLVRGRKP